MDAPELVPRCDQCIKLSFICRQGYGATGAGLKACAQCSRLKLKCSRSKIETAPVLKVILAPHTLDPPRESVVPSLQHSMEVDSEGDAMVNDLRAMTLVMNDNAAPLSKRLSLQHAADGARAELVKLQAQQTATADLLNALNDRLAAQDANIRALQDVRANMNALNDWLAAQDANICALQDVRTNMEAVQNQMKVMQQELVTRDETVQQAQAQLAWQEQATAVLQDAYNALRHCVLGQNQSLSPPFPGPIYHANPQYSGNHSMMPVSMGQMQAMEGLYFNLPAGASAMGGPSVGNVAGGSGWNGAGGLSASRSHNQITGSSHAGAHAFGELALGRGPQN
ncbi:uncharacterized protein EDB91DRAFT_1084458 [Suillus paluster]|uniref:uncharacterized protein n=1 Tax=Suillus paluster TaxID=48578 RepID=UPI001B85F3D5|nr:uncharacterized protein EDB91DRAFT_1084458 [Suillus paluster]KAG1733405.1 hypothetical protein EDB91DRAFT_1084458 [Suillus paluster]